MEAVRSGELLRKSELRKSNAMNAISAFYRFMRHRSCVGILLSLALLAMPKEASAICGLDGAVRELMRNVGNSDASQALSLKIQLKGTCAACHLARFGGPRNEFGNAINTLLTIGDREDPVRQREAGRRMKDILANPSLPDSPTFGELFQLGRYPADSLVNKEPPLPEALGRKPESVTAQQARELVTTTEAQSRFGIVQLSTTSEITLEVAEVLAKFRGDTLILGIKSLSPEVAAALTKSQAANLWLHSITTVSPDAAEAISKLHGHLVLTSLTELDSVTLAEKLASRPGALSFPFLKTISPEVASALGKTERSLTLAGLTDVPLSVQEKLAETVGMLSIPNLKSLDSLLLAKKLKAPAVLLSKVQKLTAEQLEQFVGDKGQLSFWGGIYLPITAITPELATVAAANPRSFSLTLTGTEAVSDEDLRALLTSRWNVTLLDVEQLTEGQIAVLNEALPSTTFRPGVLEFPRLSLPRLQKLDSAVLAKTLVRSSGFTFPAVTEISPEAAAALGNLPDDENKRRDGTVDIRPSGELNFPSLTELSPETAELLLKKRWLSISLPSLQDVSKDTIRLMAQQTFRLNLGISTLTPELADAFAPTPADTNMGGGFILFPNVSDLSPEAAQILVNSLNRGYTFRGDIRISNSPKIFFGGDQGFAGNGFRTLLPEVAMELARYEGTLAFQGLNELPDASAEALATFSGPYLILSGPGAETLSPAAAESLARLPGVLQIPLRELDSVPLAERLARQSSWSLFNLETVSAPAARALSEYKPFFDLRVLTTLESPEMARRFVEGTTSGSSITLPALSTLSPEAAGILASGSKPLYLGLTVIDSPAVAVALAKTSNDVSLPRLRAATAEVIKILAESKSLKMPALETLYVLSPATDQSR